MSHMHDLDYIILQHSNTHFISFQKIYTSTQLFSIDFVLLYIFCWGKSKFNLRSKKICMLKGEQN